jgi:multicomponent Na+:H+ antiporter subunit G
MIGAILILAAEAPAASAGLTIDWASVWAVLCNLITIVSVTAGVIFVLSGTIGVLRLPDFFTRLHAAGMTDTLGAELILIGLIFQADKVSAEPWQMIAKLLLVAFFLFVTSPTATHAIAHAAYRSGEKPLLGKWRAPEVE